MPRIPELTEIRRVPQNDRQTRSTQSSLISRTVFVDVKHHVYIVVLTRTNKNVQNDRTSPNISSTRTSRIKQSAQTNRNILSTQTKPPTLSNKVGIIPYIFFASGRIETSSDYTCENLSSSPSNSLH